MLAAAQRRLLPAVLAALSIVAGAAFLAAYPSIGPLTSYTEEELEFLRQNAQEEPGTSADPLSPSESPTSGGCGHCATISMATLPRLLSEVRKAFGPRTRIWLTELGYQTNPPDKILGVRWGTQARYVVLALVGPDRHRVVAVEHEHHRHRGVRAGAPDRTEHSRGVADARGGEDHEEAVDLVATEQGADR